MTTTCLKRGCPAAADYGCDDHCTRHYRQRLRMGLTGYVDSAPTIAHLEKLRAAGWTFVQIGEASGISFTIPAALLRHRYGRVRMRTERAVLAIPVDRQWSRRPVDSTGSRRRIQALAWMGWTLEDVARQADMAKSLLCTVYRPQVSHSVARRIEQVYERLAHRQGPSKGAAAKARAFGHAPPLAWDDDTIDDPAAAPSGVRSSAA